MFATYSQLFRRHYTSRGEGERTVSVGGDDAADCLRYLVATKARTFAVRKSTGW